MSTNLASDYSDGIPTLTRDDIDGAVDTFNDRWAKHGVGADWYGHGNQFTITVSEDGDLIERCDSLADFDALERRLDETR